MLCTECEQKNPIEKAIQVLYASERHVCTRNVNDIPDI